jgi:hypothetical protein
MDLMRIIYFVEKNPNLYFDANNFSIFSSIPINLIFV